MKHRRAFTLVELMAVIGIIVLLMGILVPSIMRATTAARRTRQAMDLQSIAAALTAYHNDFRAYPPVPYDGEGALTLSKALIGPEPVSLPSLKPGAKPVRGDGAEGPGFRTRPAIGNVAQGKVWGPYLNPDHFRTAGDPGFEIQDLRGQPILYYPVLRVTQFDRQGQPARYVDTWHHPLMNEPPNVNPRPFLNQSDNFDPTDAARQYMPQAKMDALLGINRASNSATRPLPAGVDYILWSAGPDELYGPIDAAHPEKCDDVIFPALP